MRSIGKDILIAVFMGAVVPGLLLNLAAAVVNQVPATETMPAEAAASVLESKPEEVVKLPILMREQDGTVIQMDMDEYLVGVLLAEIPTAFEIEAMKAQAVSARTYARKAWETGGKHGDGSVCGDSACCQAYILENDYLAQGGTEEGMEKARDAVYATSGYVLTYEGTLIEATYFSCSGGSTEDAAAVWGTEFPYLQAVDSPGEEKAVHYTDTVCFSAEEFQEALGVTLSGSPETWLRDVSYTRGDGIASMTIGEEAYSGTFLRQALGLYSTAFSIQTEGNTIRITTKGYGHRVGMSQYGADAMAVTGSDFQEILAHYYPGTVLTKLEN